ncbi:hypothetical protein AMTRI_Chr04g185320 [Amborella trichopoda]
MRDRKTHLFLALVHSTPWFGSLVGLLIEINHFFPLLFLSYQGMRKSVLERESYVPLPLN